jgi:uncharacterized protein YndB with AHSA1/START domain
MTTDENELVFECALDAPPEKVWRAVTVPEYLKRWLGESGRTDAAESVDCTLIEAEPERSVRYRWREGGEGAISGAEDSVVTFELTPMPNGGTWFRLTHTPMAMPAAANANGALVMLRAA